MIAARVTDRLGPGGPGCVPDAVGVVNPVRDHVTGLPAFEPPFGLGRVVPLPAREDDLQRPAVGVDRVAVVRP